MHLTAFGAVQVFHRLTQLGSWQLCSSVCICVQYVISFDALQNL